MHFETEGITLIKDSIFVKKNDVELKDIKVEASETGFRIETGTTLSDKDKIEVCYEVIFETESTEQTKVVNTARAKGDISPETSAQNEVYIKMVPRPSVTPTPTETPKPSETPSPALTPTPVPATTPGTCPKMTPAPTKTPVPSYNNGNSGSNGGSYGNSGGYSSGYGSYQNGSVAGSSKTGDTRPFRVMAVLGVLGLILLAGGVLIYRKSLTGRKNIRGIRRK